MSKIERLFESKWVSVNKKTIDNGGEYLYISTDWCNSQGIAILPFRRKMDYSLTELGVPTIEYLGRYELCPSHSDVVELGAIQGGMDKEGELARFTAWRELMEEGGYEVPLENIVELGSVRQSKISDGITYLFAVDLDKGYQEVKAVGDGTLIEEGGYASWIDIEQLSEAKDPLLHTMLIRCVQNNLFYGG